MTTKKCVICGATFQASTSRTTCSAECKAEQRKRYIARRRGHPIAPVGQKQRKSLSISEINRLASEHGTTYGKMAAMLRSGVYPAGKYPEN